MRRGETKQHEPARRRCLADLRAGIADRAAAVARALVHRLRRRAHDDIEPIERKIELLGRNLRECGPHPGAGLDLAGEEGRGVVGVHRKPGIELIRRRRGEVATRGAGRQPRSRVRRVGPEEGEGDDEPARSPEKPAPAEPGSARSSADRLMHSHDRPPCYACSRAARSTARTIRICVPQRHRLASRADMMAARVGCGSLSRNAVAVMIMPLMQ